MVTKKTQVVSSNLFVLALEISDFFPRTASALRSFPVFLSLDFPRLLDSQRNMLKFLINVEKDLTKLLNRLLNLCLPYTYIHSFIGFPSHPFFVSPILVSRLGCNYCIWNWLKALNMKLLRLEKNGKCTNWFGLLHFHIYLKWYNFCHYKSKFKFQKVEWNVCSVEKSICFHIRSERDSQCVYLLQLLYTPSLYTHT